MHFYIRIGNYLCVSELSLIDDEDIMRVFIGKKKLKNSNDWYFFNRLNVPSIYRNQGYGSKLMDQTIRWADQEKVNIINTLNPYGDLNMEQLIKFFTKFGFEIAKQIKETGDTVMIRYYKDNTNNG